MFRQGSWQSPSLRETQNQASTAGGKRQCPRKEAGTEGRAQGICSAFTLGQEKTGGGERPRGNEHLEPTVIHRTVFGGGGGRAGGFHKSCWWQSSQILQSIRETGLRSEHRTKGFVRQGALSCWCRGWLILAPECAHAAANSQAALPSSSQALQLAFGLRSLTQTAEPHFQLLLTTGA